jgi:hypothetical protein
MKRIFFPVLLLSVIFAASSVHGQTSHYGSSFPGGALEYSLPFLTAVPPLDSTQPTDVATAYLWLDELMRTSTGPQINNYIWSLNNGDTLRFLAEMLYSVIDNNPLSFNNWDASTIWEIGRPPLAWNYKGHPDQERTQLQNQISVKIPDTARTGFLLACDIISDVTVSDTEVYGSSTSIPMVFVNATINDEIKGQKIPLCVGEGMGALRKGKGAIPLSVRTLVPWATYAVVADTGSCLQFEYSPQWQRGIFTDEGDPLVPVLSDSTGWWVRPGGEYIVFLYLHGVNMDSAKNYFTLDPFWGVFGSQGAIYRVSGGHVIDPNDDFGLGASVSGGLTVAEWKTRLRARIYNILHP